MRYLKIFAVVIISFVAVYYAPQLFANDTLVIETATGTAKDVKIDDETTTLVIAVVTAVVNLVIHLLTRKKQEK